MVEQPEKNRILIKVRVSGTQFHPFFAAQDAGDEHTADVIAYRIDHGGWRIYQGADHGNDRHGDDGKAIKGDDHQFS